MLLRLEAVEKRFGDRCLFRGVDLEVRAGDRVGLVGPNGAGKSTLLHIAAGLEPCDAGRRHVPRTARVALLRQEIDPTLERSVRDEAATAFARLDALETEMRQLEGRMEALGHDATEVPADLAARYDQVRTRFEHGGGFEREARVAQVLAGLGFDEADRDRPLSSFSGGWLMRVELAKLLLASPEVLLLDEPTNHLDLPSIQWFEETLAAFPGAVIVVSHDRTFLRRHATCIAELDRQELMVTRAGWDQHVALRERRRAELLARRETQDRHIAQTERFIGRFRAKASKARQVQSRVKALDKLERIEVPEERQRRMRLRIPAVARSGAVVLRLSNVFKAYGETAVYQGVDFEVQRGERVALVGPNGAGKSTLLRIAAGVLDIDSGERTLGHNVHCAFFAQHQLEALRGDATVLEELASAGRNEDVPRQRGHLGAFLFSGDDVEKQVRVLSGGEKSRLALAKLLFRPANLLVLDEPTNHLDVQACEVLEDALRDYTGTLLFISHDRSFIDALATRVVEVRAGELREFLGGYEAYVRATAADPAGGGVVPGHGSRTAQRAPSREARQKERERAKQHERVRRRIAALEADILERESQVENLGWRLGDPDVHRDGDRVRELEGQRSGLREEIAALYRDWEGLAGQLESESPGD
jgi:ATP-binding cassette subfamily F protein 3